MSTTTYQYETNVCAIHMLRVNVKSLAEEAKFIRHEERRCGKCYLWRLHGHRIGLLREQSRLAQLALAYVRGRPYRSVEAEGSKPVSTVALARKLERFQIRESIKQLEAWLR